MLKIFWPLLLMTLLASCGQKTEEIDDKTTGSQPVSRLSESSEAQLRDAIDSRDTTFVKRAIENNKPFINQKFKDGDTPLTYAIKMKNQSIITEFIEVSDINIAGKDNQYPIHLSIINNLPNILNILINNKAKLNTINLFNQTPLLVALTFEKEEMALRLLTLGADYRIKDNYNFSASELAQSLRLKKVNKLISEIDSINKSGLNADNIKEIIDEGNLNLLRFTGLKYDIKTISKSANILSHVIESTSAFKNRIMLELLKLGLNANGEEGDTKIPVVKAVENDDLFSLRNLYAYEANLNIVDKSNYITPLAIAVRNLNVSIVNFLYRKGSDRTVGYLDEQTNYEINACNYIPRRGWRGYSEDVKEKVYTIKAILDC